MMKGSQLLKRPLLLIVPPPVNSVHLTFKADSHIPCHAHAAPMPFPCHAVPIGFRMCLSHLIYTVRSCLIHTFHAMPCHAMPMPCSIHAVILKGSAQHSRLSTAVQCCGLENNGMDGVWLGHGMAWQV